MILLDVNVLVYAHRQDAERHPDYRNWLERQLTKSPGLAVSELVLSGCLRVLTHPKIFKEPSPLSVALDFIEDFRIREEVHVLAPDKKHWGIFTTLCHQVEAKGNVIPDAYHAALAIEHNCEWITTDRGFARFPGLRWRHPLD
jgi:uncharacterized protein